jgi:uncharacterized repeat protein (TIGR01451 family)
MQAGSGLLVESGAAINKLGAIAATALKGDKDQAVLLTPNHAHSDLVVTKTVDPAGSVTVGAPLTYTIAVKNTGKEPAVTELSDVFPPKLRVVSAKSTKGPAFWVDNRVRADLQSIPPGGSAIVTIEATALALGDAVNQATVDEANGTEVLSNAVHTQIVEPTITLEKSLQTEFGDDDPLLEGEKFEYVITVTNTGKLDAYNVVVHDDAPGGGEQVQFGPAKVRLVQGKISGTATGISCTFPKIPAGKSAEITISSKLLLAVAGGVKNSATAVSDDGLTVATSNTVVTQVDSRNRFGGTASPEPV